MTEHPDTALDTGADAPPPLSAELACSVADRRADLQLTVPAGRRLAIVGPNGAGKSTALSLLAGHLRPDSGEVRLDGRVVSSARTHLPAHRRRVVALEQSPGLFPHLTALANVAYGPRARGLNKRDSLARARTELDAVGCGDLADRRPHQLSGGQAQRVALARALAVDPGLILLDEPLAALDAEVAPAIRRLLAERLAGRTVVMVTHDPLDLWALADDVAVISGGCVVQNGTVEDVLARPGSEFVARLAGVSLIEGEIDDDNTLRTTCGDAITGLREDAVSGWRPGARGVATIDPRAVAVHTAAAQADRADTAGKGTAAPDPDSPDPDSPDADPTRSPTAAHAPTCSATAAHALAASPRNSWPARVVGLVPSGALTRVTTELRDGQRVDAEITSRSAAELALAPGVSVTLVVKATQVSLHPRP